MSSRRISATAGITPAFDSKWFNTVWCETPAAEAIPASVTSSNARSKNSSVAARAIRSRVAAALSAREDIV